MWDVWAISVGASVLGLLAFLALGNGLWIGLRARWNHHRFMLSTNASDAEREAYMVLKPFITPENPNHSALVDALAQTYGTTVRDWWNRNKDNFEYEIARVLTNMPTYQAYFVNGCVLFSCLAVVVCYAANYLGLGAYVRPADGVTLQWLTWAPGIVVFPALLSASIALSGVFLLPHRLFHLFGFGAAAFFYGLAVFSGPFSSAATQWLGLGTGAFILLVILIGLCFAMSDESIGFSYVEVLRPLIRTIGWTPFVTVLYMFMRGLAECLAPEVGNTLSFTNTEIFVVVVDCVFIPAISILLYVGSWGSDYAKLKLAEQIFRLVVRGANTVEELGRDMYNGIRNMADMGARRNLAGAGAKAKTMMKRK